MARYTGPKSKIARKFREPIFGPDKVLEKKNYGPGMHGNSRRRGKQSEYSVQLNEKQKAKYTYGVLERQFANLFSEAARKEGITGENLLKFLEARLDNTVFRLGIAPTRSGARQLVSHKHITVNGEIVNIPSYQLVVGDTVALNPTANNVPAVGKLLADKEAVVPTWLKRKGNIGKVERVIKREDVKEMINESDIIEFYSR